MVAFERASCALCAWLEQLPRWLTVLSLYHCCYFLIKFPDYFSGFVAEGHGN